ncbi:hypothetical protein vBPaerPs25_183c [Pseudomonas phage vB_Paer_Ps25]|uniref:Uncharacterized protein n=1 Tax=Pseudomonas phage vB_Paer_Ps12 TaxID=2924904 RepID=A0AAE9GTI4_9CAUD|nr:hypothetical protein QE347_gp188 [Pseudomonas phage vB_Paer_Ps12]UOL47640.1 hypothetical protein vBPaerPs12_184c [Pseudomonas phage vB_Paer_Ps12]UOL47827.1 hypothetical protein vBPaerPs25_183c [Pseudomonas phage vB_Paer_Ps25]
MSLYRNEIILSILIWRESRVSKEHRALAA